LAARKDNSQLIGDPLTRFARDLAGSLNLPPRRA
jgi:hypothetical protein